LSGLPTSLDPLTIEKTLDWIRSNLDGTPSAEQLRAIRTILDDATFVPVLEEALKRRIGHNSGISIPNELSALMRLSEERRDQKETHRGWVNQIGLAGSGALVFGGILACLNPAIGNNSGRGWHFRGRNITFRYEAVGRGEDPLQAVGRKAF
jgi:hypothetical protein